MSFREKKMEFNGTADSFTVSSKTEQNRKHFEKDLRVKHIRDHRHDSEFFNLLDKWQYLENHPFSIFLYN